MGLLDRVRDVRRVAEATIADPEQHTVIDERTGVRSTQAADVRMSMRQLDAIWSAMHLERLARTYWRYLSRVCLGLIRVHYTATERAVVLIGRPFVLLRFRAPEYELSSTHGAVRWSIESGLLVAPRGHHGDGYLEIDVERREDPAGGAVAHVRVTVANFYPSLWFGIAKWFYVNTQSRVHVIVTHGFLRSLERLELPESRVGRFARYGVGAVPPPGLVDRIDRSADAGTGRNGGSAAPPVDVTEGSTPWAVVATLALGNAVAVALAVRLWRRRSGD